MVAPPRPQPAALAAAFAWLALLPGCAGPNDETVLSELRVLAMIPDAPEVAPMETTTLRTRIVDPAEQGGRALVWTCTLLGETCLEDEEGRSVSVVEPVDGWVETAVAVSPALAAVASEEPLPLLLAWALVCSEGVCPLLADVEQGAEIDPEVWASPLDWMESLPMEGTSLAFTTIQVSTRAPGARHENPTLSWTEAPSTAEVGATVPLVVQAEGTFGTEPTAWGYSEGAAFTMSDVALESDGSATLDWVAPAEAGATTAMVLVLDDLGGSALVEASVDVQ